MALTAVVERPQAVKFLMQPDGVGMHCSSAAQHAAARGLGRPAICNNWQVGTCW
jgi:hypothetical protein